MKLKFTKMQGCGNDYIYISCFDKQNAEIINNPALSFEALVKDFSDRHFGIGGDGVVLILPSSSADAMMRMFNADGSEGKMCGNAIRCSAKFLYDNKIINKTEILIDTLSGIKKIHLNTEKGVVTSARVNMGEPAVEPYKIAVSLDGNNVINRKITLDGKVYKITCVSMGNPHAVVFYDNAGDIETLEIEKIGPLFEHAAIFPDGVNTEFVHISNRNSLTMRVWERGSGETLACGTGACAAAVAAVLNGYCGKNEDICVNLRGGRLIINYSDDGVYMTGGCEKVFDGIISVN